MYLGRLAETVKKLLDRKWLFIHTVMASGKHKLGFWRIFCIPLASCVYEIYGDDGMSAKFQLRNSECKNVVKIWRRRGWGIDRGKEILKGQSHKIKPLRYAFWA